MSNNSGWGTHPVTAPLTESTEQRWEICLMCGKRKNADGGPILNSAPSSRSDCAGEACPYCECKSLRMRLKAAEEHIGYQRDSLFAWDDNATSEQRVKHDNMLQCMRNYAEAGKKYKTCDESRMGDLKKMLERVREAAQNTADCREILTILGESY